jgi:hypothetical protein
MTLEQQVTSLELSNRLKELSVKQVSYFKWVLRRGTWSVWDEGMRSEYETGIEKEYSAAFTVAELGEMLPPERSSFMDENSGKWKMYIHSVMTGSVSKIIAERTEAHARAKMLVYLLENKLITLP